MFGTRPDFICVEKEFWMAGRVGAPYAVDALSDLLQIIAAETYCEHRVIATEINTELKYRNDAKKTSMQRPFSIR